MRLTFSHAHEQGRRISKLQKKQVSDGILEDDEIEQNVKFFHHEGSPPVVKDTGTGKKMVFAHSTKKKIQLTFEKVTIKTIP